jgi:hypothetical protein
MDAGMVLSGRKAKDYNRTHFKLQRKKKRESRIATKNSNFKNSSFKTQLIEPISI